MTTATIDTFADILTALERNPELREAMRRLILTDELMQLPDTVARLLLMFEQLAATVNAMAERQERMENAILDNRNAILDNRNAIDGNRQAILDNRNAIDGNRQAILDNRNAIDGNRQAILDNRNAIRDNRQAIDGNRQAILDNRQAIDSNRNAINELKAEQVITNRRLNRVEGKVNHLMGSDYERKIVRGIRRTARRWLRLHNAAILLAVTVPDNTTIPDIMEQAVNDGRITDDDADYLDQADIILIGDDADTQMPAYAVLEVSITIDDRDIDRAQERARILERADGHPARAACIGSAISDANRERADDLGVVVITLPSDYTD